METEYTADELLALRAKWWLRACDEGRIGMIKCIIRQLGTRDVVTEHASYLLVKHGDLTFLGSASGRSFEVKLKDRLVAGEWEEFSLYVPGWWEKELDVLYKQAMAEAARERRESQEEDRLRLIRELWLDTPMSERQPTHN